MAKRSFFFLTLKIPSGQDEPISPAQVANQNSGFAPPCPLAEAVI